MSAFIRASVSCRRSFGVALRHSLPLHVLPRISTSAFIFPHTRHTTSCTELDSILNQSSRRHYSSSPGKFASGWLKRKLLTLLALAGVSGGAFLIVSPVLSKLAYGLAGQTLL